MDVRAGIIVTGTEVLTGRVTDQNGPWVAERLLDLGVDVAHITICGDRPDDLLAQLSFLSAQGVSLIVTTGGLGPTADDLTVDTVARFTGRPMALDKQLESQITAVVAQWRRDDGGISDANRLGIQKQAMIPEGAQQIPPVGTAPGVAIKAAPEADTSLPAILVLPGPPSELRSMWPQAIGNAAISDSLPASTDFRQGTLRLFGLIEADLAATLRDAESSVDGFDHLEITTCMRRGELEMVTRYPTDAADSYHQLVGVLSEHHAAQIFSTDGSTIDDQVSAALTGRLIATAESCTGGLVAARLTERAGSSNYVVGGVVSYSNDVKTGSLDVPADVIASLGAVSEPVAAAMAEGALRHLGADTAVSTTGVAGPDGGSEEKPVGTVCFAVAMAGCPTITRTAHLPGDRAAVRDRSTTVAMHMLADALAEPRSQ